MLDTKIIDLMIVHPSTPNETSSVWLPHSQLLASQTITCATRFRLFFAPILSASAVLRYRGQFR